MSGSKLQYFFRWMGVSWDKKRTWISLDISPLFFQTVSKLVQALVITCDKIFQTLAVKWDVLLPKTFLDLGLSKWSGKCRWRGQKWPCVNIRHFRQWHRRFSPDDTVKAEVKKCLREQNVSFYRQGLENLVVRYDKCLNKFGNCMQRYRTDVQRYLCGFLVSIYLLSDTKKIGSLTFRLPLVYLEEGCSCQPGGVTAKTSR
jgi:hypothetical protein